ncbi:hypothetical protein [Mycolicibacterium aubagnense]|uniref:Uncharacterized protein n=1 Tax=Mycolicibacterium aubagnense TaxID=319707 RepID=A0ABM7IMK5_9MYCO|nr:hypothetical protein [Mycolicibacterium aubagnense]TLH64303.1 hypothetical protein C1S80_12925 [Mycolicibacterium aubagnense]BBX87958.1 hypothetical protein MAUB_58310 [Mycolicibacterium aubagnense]
MTSTRLSSYVLTDAVLVNRMRAASTGKRFEVRIEGSSAPATSLELEALIAEMREIPITFESLISRLEEGYEELIGIGDDGGTRVICAR